MKKIQNSCAETSPKLSSSVVCRVPTYPETSPSMILHFDAHIQNQSAGTGLVWKGVVLQIFETTLRCSFP